jgi:DNA-binding NtrC family response regulator
VDNVSASSLDALLRATRRLMLAKGPERVRLEIPRAALEVVPADSAILIQARQTGLVTLGQFGPTLASNWGWFDRAVQTVMHDGRPQLFDGPDGSEGSPDKGRLIVAPMRNDAGPMAIAVARLSSKHRLRAHQVPELGALGLLASSWLGRAEDQQTAVQATAMLDAALAVAPGGMVMLDSAGRIKRLDARAAMESLAAFMRSPRPSADGRRVHVPGGEVAVAMHVWDGGTALLLGTVGTGARSATVPSARYTFSDLIARDPVMLETLDRARRVALTDVDILLTGETGTGKEVVAQAIHNESLRAGQPFVALNVAAIPSELLESELFGYAEGAFTGARAQGRAGRFEEAGGGTILLDEIGEMPAPMQAKLLRVLQERQVTRLGGGTVHVGARVIATTHRSLDKEVAEGRFRLDLYHRLRVATLNIPSLRERPLDLDPLADHYLSVACERLGRPEMHLLAGVRLQLRTHDWPGNVRELQNLLMGVVSLMPEAESVVAELPIFPEHPEFTPIAAPSRSMNPESVLPLEEVERMAIQHAVGHFSGNMSKVARALGISRSTLYAKLDRYELR